MRACRLCVAACALLCALAHGVARAQPDDARRLFEEGVAQLQDSRFAEAVASLEQSLALRENPAVAYNLALAYRGAGQYRRAIASFERFLQIAGPRQTSLRSSASQLLAELRESIARVTLAVRGGATDVRVDGERRGTADGEWPLELDPGRHELEARRAGYEPALREVELAPGARERVVLDASRRPVPATVVVETGLTRARISIDGEHVGDGRYQARLRPGRYVIQVSARRHVTTRRTVEVGPGTTQRIMITPVPVRGPAAPADDASVLSRWWFWVGATVIVAGAVTAVVIAAQPGPQRTYDGSLGFTVEALSR